MVDKQFPGMRGDREFSKWMHPTRLSEAIDQMAVVRRAEASGLRAEAWDDLLLRIEVNGLDTDSLTAAIVCTSARRRAGSTDCLSAAWSFYTGARDAPPRSEPAQRGVAPGRLQGVERTPNARPVRRGPTDQVDHQGGQSTGAGEPPLQRQPSPTLANHDGRKPRSSGPPPIRGSRRRPSQDSPAAPSSFAGAVLTATSPPHGGPSDADRQGPGVNDRIDIDPHNLSNHDHPPIACVPRLQTGRPGPVVRHAETIGKRGEGTPDR